MAVAEYTNLVNAVKELDDKVHSLEAQLALRS